ncbi:MAG: hypothetical protein U5K69_26980 [Balneolaceae bacterium]|nr:hypothetical protein [Balneolaceae bacterium]
MPRTSAHEKSTVTKNEDNPLTGQEPEITELIDYEAFRGSPLLQQAR